MVRGGLGEKTVEKARRDLALVQAKIESIKPLIKKFRKYGIPEDRFYCILAGNNAKLKETIAKSCPSDKVQAVGFTDKVHLYLKAADVVISKSGGLSSIEVAVANVPVPLPEFWKKHAD